MFSPPPATRKSHFSSHRDPNPPGIRPTTGCTPAPWLSRFSLIGRSTPGRKTQKEGATDSIQPVHVGEFPEQVRNAQATFLHKSLQSDTSISGGIDKGTSLSWIVYDNQIFIWRYLSPATSKQCIVLEIPQHASGGGDVTTHSNNSNKWMVCILNWNSTCGIRKKYEKQSDSVGIIMCNKKSQVIVYWPDVYSEGGGASFVHPAACDGSGAAFSSHGRKSTPHCPRQHSRLGSSYLVEKGCFNSIIASPIPGICHVCVALAAGSDGELWMFRCSPSGVSRESISFDFNILSMQSSDSRQALIGKGYPRSLIWRHQLIAHEESNRQLLLLTDHEIQCFSISLDLNLNVAMVWSHEIIGLDNDLGIKKDLAGQKQIWPLDMQIDDRGKELSILLATFCKDRVSSSSYTQYSLLTMQYKPGVPLYFDNIEPICERILEKKAPVQVIIPKARVEDENFLFSMKLHVGGKPSGSAIILSGDGTATVSNYWRNMTRLYQFDLPWDAGKVLNASVLPSTEDWEEGAWVVVTEKAGVWAIPEKAVLLGGVEPPERSLSRKGSLNERATDEERRNLSFGGNVAPRRASSEAWDAGDRRRVGLSGTVLRTAQDEESEALLSRLFHDFLLSGQVEDPLEKLRTSGAFEKEAETNVFTRMSKSIIDTLAKHWTTTRGAEVVATAVTSSQLSEKQQKHSQFLQFLAFSKCHEELFSRQRYSLQTIMEHGEKLAGIVQLRELQNTLSQKQSNGTGVPHSDSHYQMAGSLWDLIQLVGEKARRNTVLLMDRDNAEVFYSKVSDLEEVFWFLSYQLQEIIGGEQPIFVQIARACELSNACTLLIHTAMQYRNEHDTWYPMPEGLTPWYCKNIVRKGLWCVASFMLQLLNESANWREKLNLYSHLEQLTEILLESYNVTNTGKVERREEQKGILDEYRERRDELLDSLYQHIKGFVDEKYQHQTESVADSKEDYLQKVSLPLLSIARRHEGYQTLWNICCDLNDSTLLRKFMHDSVGPTGGFSYFVFEQLYEIGQFVKLLRLGEEFQEELAIFLRQHNDLRWLHEVFLNQFFSASESLHALALSQECDASTTDENSDRGLTRRQQSLADRKRQLNLSKIAAMADSTFTGKDGDSVMRIKGIAADLKILKLQEEIIALLSVDVEKQNARLLPQELIKLCLNGNTKELSLQAFEVFAWTSSSFRKSNRELLVECWKNAANQNNWDSLYQASIAEGWSEEQALQNLSETILFRASNRCYGSLAQTFQGEFDEVLPVRQDEMEATIPRDPTSSVERILMQHKNFPVAGQLMLTAIVFGQVGAQSFAKKQSFTPME